MQQSEKERAEFSIGELAVEFDVTPRAIRFYEDHGLLGSTLAHIAHNLGVHLGGK